MTYASETTGTPDCAAVGEEPDDAPDRPEPQDSASVRQVWWGVVVGIPGLLSIFRLWLEAGGDTQITLLLVQHVSPFTLATVLVTATISVFSAVLVAGLVCHAVIERSMPQQPARERSHGLLLGRWTLAVPAWFKWTTFLIALATWDILFIPLLALALCFLCGWRPLDREFGIATRIAFGAAVVGYFVVFGPTLVNAFLQSYLLPIVILAGTPLVATIGVARLTGRWLPLFTQLSRVGIAVVALVGVYVALTTPILPLTSVTVTSGTPSPLIRGFVLDINDMDVILLREHGGVLFLPADDVTARTLCPSNQDPPRYRLWVYDLHIEDSLIQAVGRMRRPSGPVDARCRESIRLEPIRK